MSSTHTNSRGVKTDAPWSIIWDIMRCWYKQAQGVLPRPRQPQEGSHVAKLLAKEPSLEASFARNTAALSAARVAGKSRFPDNPEEHWGPQVGVQCSVGFRCVVHCQAVCRAYRTAATAHHVALDVRRGDTGSLRLWGTRLTGHRSARRQKGATRRIRGRRRRSHAFEWKSI